MDTPSIAGGRYTNYGTIFANSIHNNGKLKRANAVQIYLRVVTIADLTDLRGICIRDRMLTGEWQTGSDIKWPHQPLPQSKAGQCSGNFLYNPFVSYSPPTNLYTRAWPWILLWVHGSQWSRIHVGLATSQNTPSTTGEITQEVRSGSLSTQEWPTSTNLIKL